MSVAPSESTDVVVLGGGPAGASAARLLAAWGHRVLLVNRPQHRAPLAESLPPSCEGLLDAIGVRALVDDAGFVRSTGNTVWWGRQPRRVEFFPGGRLGHQVERSAFDALLRRAAEEAGAIVRHPAVVRAVHDVEGAHDVEVESEGALRVVRARWVLDATGRVGLIARRLRTRATSDVRTLALAGIWERDGGWDLPDETHTLVESAPHGWGWSVPVDARRRYFTVMLDPRDTPVREDVGTRYATELARLAALGAIAQGGRRVGAAWACDASPHDADPVAGETALRLGDAASFIDPLSSFGVKKALASGWLAAVTVNTALRTPAMHAAALALYADRERAYVATAARELAAVSHDATSPSPEAAFWAARSRAGDDADEQHVETLRSDPAVQAAFADLRARASGALRVAEGTCIEPRPLVRGRLVVLEPHLVTGAFPGGVRFLRNVDLLGVLRVAGGENDVGRMFELYQAEHPPVPLPDFLGALAVLVGKRVCDFA